MFTLYLLFTLYYSFEFFFSFDLACGQFRPLSRLADKFMAGLAQIAA